MKTKTTKQKQQNKKPAKKHSPAKIPTPKITTLKLEAETKNRLEKLREHKRETYDEIIKKILYILNTARDSPDKARAILEFINAKRKSMVEQEKEEAAEGK